MRKLLKWIGTVSGGLIMFLAVAAGVVLAWTEAQFNHTYNIQPEMLEIPSVEEAIARGRHLEDAVMDCTLCHGADLGGGVFVDEPGLFTIYAPNLTAGEGGAGAYFADEDWVRAIHHGVGADGKALLFMPADIFTHLSAEDLAAVIAYAKSFPPVDNKVQEPKISLIARAFIVMGQIPAEFIVPARFIDHGVPINAMEKPALSPEYGEYLVSIAYCTYCHRKDLAGGPFPFPDPNAPQVPNLRAAGQWSLEQFKAAIRTGFRPSGNPLNPEYMPWRDYHMTDEELEAIWLYLQSLPPKE
jgi:cytochrome c553